MTYFYMTTNNRILQVSPFDSRELALYKLEQFNKRYPNCYIEIEHNGQVIEIIR